MLFLLNDFVFSNICLFNVLSILASGVYDLFYDYFMIYS